MTDQIDYEAWVNHIQGELDANPDLKQLLEDLSDAFLNGSNADFMEQMETISVLVGHV